MCQIESKATKLYMIYIPCLQEEHLVRQLKYLIDPTYIL
jgi:hypothetical protein